ncbi:MAG: hypothetical protein AVDCRST_MAG41-3500 [uncultured Corynebacteriales bacterium]|uniref:Uncharacterized protein n=1 Tax=uncultured Mycobacteriales bacterium TaxID=581187 RepID=A0A6J4JJN2_9ACTN|nr:MAG: hypothetical protein AVDCRST_MAG41-3500 [uncultured Corynebacteriales bacterium]
MNHVVYAAPVVRRAVVVGSAGAPSCAPVARPPALNELVVEPQHEDVATTLGIYTDVPAGSCSRWGTRLLSIEPGEDPGNEEDPSGDGS